MFQNGKYFGDSFRHEKYFEINMFCHKYLKIF